MLAQTISNHPTVTIFSPTDNLPIALADMSNATLSAHITKAQNLLEFHQDTARNGNAKAEHYYFFIPEVARDMANARYTLNIMFAEINRRKFAANLRDIANAGGEICRDDYELAIGAGVYEIGGVQ